MVTKTDPIQNATPIQEDASRDPTVSRIGNSAGSSIVDLISLGLNATEAKLVYDDSKMGDKVNQAFLKHLEASQQEYDRIRGTKGSVSDAEKREKTMDQNSTVSGINDVKGGTQYLKDSANNDTRYHQEGETYKASHDINQRIMIKQLLNDNKDDPRAVGVIMSMMGDFNEINNFPAAFGQIDQTIKERNKEEKEKEADLKVAFLEGGKDIGLPPLLYETNPSLYKHLVEKNMARIFAHSEAEAGIRNGKLSSQEVENSFLSGPGNAGMMAMAEVIAMAHLKTLSNTEDLTVEQIPAAIADGRLAPTDDLARSIRIKLQAFKEQEIAKYSELPGFTIDKIRAMMTPFDSFVENLITGYTVDGNKNLTDAQLQITENQQWLKHPKAFALKITSSLLNDLANNNILSMQFKGKTQEQLRGVLTDLILNQTAHPTPKGGGGGEGRDEDGNLSKVDGGPLDTRTILRSHGFDDPIEQSAIMAAIPTFLTKLIEQEDIVNNLESYSTEDLTRLIVAPMQQWMFDFDTTIVNRKIENSEVRAQWRTFFASESVGKIVSHLGPIWHQQLGLNGRRMMDNELKYQVTVQFPQAIKQIEESGSLVPQYELSSNMRGRGKNYKIDLQPLESDLYRSTREEVEDKFQRRRNTITEQRQRARAKRRGEPTDRIGYDGPPSVSISQAFHLVTLPNGKPGYDIRDATEAGLHPYSEETMKGLEIYKERLNLKFGPILEELGRAWENVNVTDGGYEHIVAIGNQYFVK
jgi:hypothetical protein